MLVGNVNDADSGPFTEKKKEEGLVHIQITCMTTQCLSNMLYYDDVNHMILCTRLLPSYFVKRA